ncbi:MAG: TIGR02206 family membrane protein [Candidatus Marinimicrobia bacterium]|nr:TIGR02206 family membrane protein [Candidatus Neomarinimicrobiota bacterium]
MTPHDTIPLFGTTWFLTNTLTFSAIVLIIYLTKKIPKKYVKNVTLSIGVFIILRVITQHTYQIVHGTWNYQSSLNLHLCGIAAVIAGIVMFYRPQWLFEVLYFWGVPGAFHSFMTPEYTLGSEGWMFIDYYLEHGGIWLGAFYLIFVLGMKPRRGSWWKIFVYTQLLVIVLGVFNYLFDANYMYLCVRPVVENPFIVGEWPWYTLGIELAGLLHFLIVYLPFGIKYRKENVLATA